MFVSVASHTLYHSRFLAFYFFFVLEFNIWHRIGRVHPQVCCCSIFNFLCSALQIIVCFFSLGHWIICTRFVYHERFSLWQIQTFGHWIVCPSICGFGFLLIAPDYSLLPLLYPLIVPLISSNFPFFCLPLCYLLITLLAFSDHSSDYLYGIFWLLLRYFLIAP